jgi:Concanavalin A-like lectin/glucanases superfamily
MNLRVFPCLLCLLTGWALRAADPLACYDLSAGAVDLTCKQQTGSVILCQTTKGPRDKQDALSMGPDSRVSLPIDLSHAKDYSVSLWVNKICPGDSFFLSNDGWFQGFGFGWGWPESNGKEHLVFFAGDGARWIKADAQTLLTGTGWHHLTSTVDRNDGIRLYFDGNQIASAFSELPLRILPGSPTILSCCGMAVANGESCRISQVVFHDKALSQSEIARLAGGMDFSWLAIFRILKLPLIIIGLILLVTAAIYKCWRLIRADMALPQAERRLRLRRIRRRRAY